MEQEMNKMPEEQGRGTDTVMAHLSLGEVVIPRAFLDDPQVMQVLQQIFDSAGANMAEFTVGDPANKINPETGYPEFFFKKIFRALKKIALPAALSYFAPGIGTALGGALGAGASFAPILGGAAFGAGTNALTGGNILQGAALGGLGGGIQSAAAGNFNDTALGRGISSVSNSFGDVLGNFGDAPLGDGISGATRPSSGILGSIGSATGITNNSLPSFGTGAVEGAGSGASSSAYGGSSIGNILGGLTSVGAQDDAAEQLLKQQRMAQQQYEPFLNQTFDAGDFQADPGYQFRQQEGEKALERSQAARGGLFSGNALREASAFNQGNADQAYNEAFNRWLQTQQQGLNAAGAVQGTYDNVGNIQAGNTLANSNTFNNTLSNILGGGNVAEDIDPLTGKPRKRA
jgi:hypothetical protein